jgi:glycerate kinase
VAVHVLAAPDKFRGTAGAAAVADAIAAGAHAAGAECERLPLADGGEGFLDALGGANRVETVSGPLGDPVEAPWRLVRRTAVIEMALAAGLALVGGPDGNDAVAASTAGVGELIAAAVETGAQRVLVGLGGSATTDGGLGALRALYPLPRLRAIELVIACDVSCSFVDAAEVFAPQKGASPAEVELLRRRLERLAQVYLDDHGVDVTGLQGAGAAGGLAGGLAVAGGELVSGFQVVADELDLWEHLEDADLVVTGEGFCDEQSFDGMVVGGVVEAAADAGVPVLVVAGQLLDGVERRAGKGVTFVSLTDRFGEDCSRSDPAKLVAEVVRDHLKAFV